MGSLDEEVLVGSTGGHTYRFPTGAGAVDLSAGRSSAASVQDDCAQDSSNLSDWRQSSSRTPRHLAAVDSSHKLMATIACANERDGATVCQSLKKDETERHRAALRISRSDWRAAMRGLDNIFRSLVDFPSKLQDFLNERKWRCSLCITFNTAACCAGTCLGSDTAVPCEGRVNTHCAQFYGLGWLEPAEREAFCREQEVERLTGLRGRTAAKFDMRRELKARAEEHEDLTWTCECGHVVIPTSDGCMFLFCTSSHCSRSKPDFELEGRFGRQCLLLAQQQIITANDLMTMESEEPASYEAFSQKLFQLDKQQMDDFAADNDHQARLRMNRKLIRTTAAMSSALSMLRAGTTADYANHWRIKDRGDAREERKPGDQRKRLRCLLWLHPLRSPHGGWRGRTVLGRRISAL